MKLGPGVSDQESVGLIPGLTLESLSMAFNYYFCILWTGCKAVGLGKLCNALKNPEHSSLREGASPSVPGMVWQLVLWLLHLIKSVITNVIRFDNSRHDRHGRHWAI